jgi:ATP synthase F1 gamma subunit
MRTAGQRPTALSPAGAIVAVRSAPAAGRISTHHHMQQSDASAASGAAGFAGEEQVRCANLKAIQIRMKSVSSVAKITKAMKMVAAAKLRTVQTLQENARPFADGMQDFFMIMDDVEDASVAAVADPAAEGTKSTSLIVAVTSDRGLCGGVNSSVVRDVKRLIEETPDVHHSILLVGDKGRDGIARLHGNAIEVSFKDVFKNPVTFPQICVIAEDILNRNFDEITLVYNEFKSVIQQQGNFGILSFTAMDFDAIARDADTSGDPSNCSRGRMRLPSASFGLALLTGLT